MMKQIFFISSLILGLSLLGFSQIDTSKTEIRKTLIKFEIKRRDRILANENPYFHENVNNFVDSLNGNNVDTIGIFDKSYPGFVADDSCSNCGMFPWETYIHWRQGEKYFQAKITECCEPQIREIDNSAILSYYINSSAQLDKEFIFPVTTGMVKNKKGELEIAGIGRDHTVNYFIYCRLNEKKYAIQFDGFALEEERNIFLKDNLESPINSWRKLIENQIAELEKK